MKIRRFVVFGALLSLIAFSFWSSRPRAHAAPVPSAAPVEGQAEWTILLYMDADNDLELAQMGDLKEMLAAGSNKDVNIIVLADRSEKGDGRKYTNEGVANLKNWTTAKLLYVEKGNLRELADWGEADMGDPATLKKFLQVGKQFPAKHYAVVLEDHGTGWPGACADESNGDNMLTSQEIATAFSEAPSPNGKYDLVGFDACLMANLEVAKVLAPSAHIMVASEELEPGDGWSYTALLQTLERNPKMTGPELGRTIVDTFDDSFNKSDDENMRDQGQGITLSVLDLDQIGPLEKAVSDLGVQNQSALAKSGQKTWEKMARARSHAEEYGKDGKDSEGNKLYDLHNLTQNLQTDLPGTDTAKSADAVLAALKPVVLYSKHGSGRPNASGLSIFFPAQKQELTEEPYGKIDYTHTGFAANSKWFPFLSAYTGAEATDTTAPVVADVATTDADMAATDVATVSADVKADDIDDAKFVLVKVENGEQTILGALPTEPDEKGHLKESWDGKWFTIGDKDKELICPITGFEEIDAAADKYWVIVPAQVRFKDTDEWFDVSLYFSTDFNGEQVTGDFVYAFEQTKHGPREIELETGDEMRPVYYTIDAKGEEHYEASDNKDDILILTEGDVTIGREAVDKGAYRIGFIVTDLAGNTTGKFTDVKIE